MKLKKLVASMAVTVLALGSMFMTAVAEDVATGGDAVEPETGDIYVGGTVYDATKDQSGRGWKWDVDTYTLTLNGFDGTDIKLESDFSSVVNLVINGDNTISTDREWDAIFLQTELGEFTVSGTGTLNVTYCSEDIISFNEGDGTAEISDVTFNVTETEYGFYAENMTLTNVTINVESIYGELFDCWNKLVIDSSDLVVNGYKDDDGDLYASLVESVKTVEVINGTTITCNGLYSVFANYNYSDDTENEDAEKVTVSVNDSTITGSAGSAFVIFDDFNVTNSQIDMQALAGIYTDNFNITSSNVKLVGEAFAMFYVGMLNVSESEVYFENGLFGQTVIGNMQITEDIPYGFEDYSFVYENPEYWGLFLDGELSEEFGVDSEGIDFTGNSLEIKYTHECVFDIYVSDGEETHTAMCECGEIGETEAHVWDEGTVVKEPEIDVEGELKYLCASCGDAKMEPIDALEAPPEADPSQPDTGDNSSIALILIMLVAATGVVVASKKRA
ncbi:MAG: LPXTG cell wall anchor domain-containing protein [Lachnospiraceae bacterium]|nr:LPXTG cell wall anchor domain-containing protein [Lachnospiraceae bacterium]